jgi:kumamolisin
MRRAALFCLSVLFGFAFTSIAAAGEPLGGAPDAAVLVRQPPPDRLIDFQISLPLRNEAALDRLIGDLQNPASPRYRRYLTPAEFTARFGPTPADYGAVLRFARANGLTVVATAANRRLVALRGPAGVVDQALHVVLGLYRHTSESRLFLAPDRAPTPAIGVPVLAVTGLDTEVLPRPRLVRGHGDAPHTTGSGPGGQFIGADMRAAYYGGTALTGAGQSVGLFELGGYNIEDVERYFATLHEKATVPVVGVSVAGASLSCDQGCDDSEQALDIEETIAMAPGLDRVSVYVGTTPILVLNAMAVADHEQQISCSWGWNAHAAALDPIFKEFIVQGQSVLIATGDDGFLLKRGVVWPADDQYATAVGGTDLVTRGKGGPWAAETGWLFSGGGASPDGVLLPAYQAPFVTAANQASSVLRNVPDIAAEANTDNYSCYDGGCSGGNGGTSYAAPRWAGFVALANQQAAALGHPAIGFLNPTLYALGASAQSYDADFHDQTQGYNGEYFAVPGFDLVTGLGSPDGQSMIDALAGR